VRRLIVVGLPVAIAYVLAAQVGFRFAFVAEQVTTVWAPTGIGVAALLLWGLPLWPAIWTGAFVANAGSDAPLWTAAAVATGNTLEAVAATWILRHAARFDERLCRLRDVVAFITIAAGFSTTVSATIGVTTFCFAAVQPWGRFAELWGNWWLGDAVGALVVAPVILTTGEPTRWLRGRWAGALVLVAGAVMATFVVFGQVLGPTVGHHPLEYVIFPFVIAAAVKHGQPVTAYIVFATSAVTIWNTVRGAGPFAGAGPLDSLILLQVFMAVLAGTGLLLTAATAERETSQQRRAAAHAVGEVLASAQDLATAAPAVLRAIGENLEWQVAALWLADPRDGLLTCLAVWTEGGTSAPAFARATRDTVLPPGIGLPGRVWASGQPAWITDVVEDSNFPRVSVARESGLHGAFGCPLRLGEEILGVIECFHRRVVPPDPDLLRTMSTVGHQVGQFIGRKREETALTEEQRRTSAILDAALDAVIGIDHRGIISDFNPAAVRTFGYAREAAVGRDLAELLIPPSLRENRGGLTRYVVTGNKPFINQRVETVGYHADGHEFPVEIAIVRVSDEEPPRFTGFVRDLSASKQAEREREQLLLREAAARREAEAANRAKDEFLATLSHELRTPLNAIVGWTRMLLDGTVDPRSTRRALEVIDRNAHLQSQLVADILDVSRIITGGLRLDVRPLDLGTVIGAALDAIRPAADAKKVQLRSRLMASEAVIQGDPQRLQQVVWNLLANAVKFNRAGGTVTIELLGAGAGILIRVLDDGVGIDPAFLPFVFERFRQADGSVSRQHGGLGLGLAIVRHLVELHGGTVRAESAGRDKGATFVVELPKLDAADAATLPDQTTGPLEQFERPSPSVLVGYRLLVVDDEEDARELIAAILKDAGAAVQTASSVSDALQKLDVARPDALLADIGMPDADGYALIREVRRRDARSGRHLPAAAITAYAGDHDRNRAVAAGFDHHVPKPISRAAIVAAVMSMCQGRNQAS
jgi:PAS domain S-box-containing protein